jgi:hypothetical protein
MRRVQRQHQASVNIWAQQGLHQGPTPSKSGHASRHGGAMHVCLRSKRKLSRAPHARCRRRRRRAGTRG